MDNCPACKREFKGIEDFHEGVLDLPNAGAATEPSKFTFRDPSGAPGMHN